MNTRKTYSEAQQTALVSQVNRVCPLCTQPLFHKKKTKSFKSYELAHIYPLNPTAEEIELLKNEELLADDVNDEKNIIPLCESCHGKFDRPRTIEEYRQLSSIKKKLTAQTIQEQIWQEYNIEGEISDVITTLYKAKDIDLSSDIEFSPKTVDEKLDDTMATLTRRKIKNNVSEYFIFIRSQFSELDQKEPDLSERISLQIKTYYLKQKSLGLTQQDIFQNIVSWLNAKTRPQIPEATEILASFFVQNCEVF